MTKYGIMIIAAVLLVAMAFAGAASAEGHTHDSISFDTKLTATGGSLTSGNYYLDDDVELTTDITISSGNTVNLCLNGHILKGTGSKSVITIESGATLNLYDCGTQVHKFTPNEFGVWVLDETTGTSLVTGGVITNGRQASGNGGGVYVSGSLNMYGGNIVGNSAGALQFAKGAGVCHGGGVCINGGTMTMSSGIISGNWAYYGGGGIISINGNLLVTGTATISKNVAGKTGGGIYGNGGSSITIKENALITQNQALGNPRSDDTSGSGNGVYYTRGGGGIYSSGNLLIDGGTISKNSAGDHSGGGGVFWYPGSLKSAVISSGVITENEAVIGGGIFTSGGTLTISGGEISKNIAIPGEAEIAAGYNRSASGGAIFMYGSTITLSDSVFVKNNLAKYGAGIFEAGGSINLNGGEIKDNGNENTANGKAIYVSNSGINGGVTSTLNVGNNVVVATDNDVYLDNGRTIKVTSALTSTASIKSIVPSILTDGTEIVTVTYDGGTAATVRNNFALQSSEKALKVVDSSDTHKLVVADADSWSTYADTTWYNDQDTEFTLTTPEQLAGLAELVNTGTDDFTDKTIKLGADIDLSGLDWTPIGSWSSSKAFSGTFDGQNHIISNYCMSLKSQNGVGLFGFIDKAELKNIVAISGDVIGKRFVGSVVGATRDSEITNIHVTIPEDVAVLGVEGVGGAIGCQIGGSDVISQIYVTMNGKVGADWSNTDSSGVGDMHGLIGGVIGWTCSGSVSASDISITGTGCVDGAVGIGGFLGKAQSGGTFSLIAVDLDVIGSSTGRIIGGAIGYVAPGTLHLSEISVSINDILGRGDVGGCLGAISCSSPSDVSNVVVHIVNMTGYLYAPGSGQPDTNVGGISGSVNANNHIISNAYSVIDTINLTTSSVKVGGICSSTNSLTIENSVSLVKRIIGSTTSSVGRIFNSEACVLENNYAWEGMLVYGNYITDGTSSNKNGADVSSVTLWNNQSFFDDTLEWDFDNVWKMNSGNDNYQLPVLKWQTTPVSGDASYLKPVAVTFDSKGGSDVAEQKITKGFKATEPTPAPTKLGYTFAHWYQNIAAPATAFDFDTALTADTTLYANWTATPLPSTVDPATKEATFESGLPVVKVNVGTNSITQVTFQFMGSPATISTKPTGFTGIATINDEFDLSITGTQDSNVTVFINATSTNPVFLAHYKNSAWEFLPAEAVAGVSNQYKVIVTPASGFSPYQIVSATPQTTAITLDANGGSIGTSSVTATYGSSSLTPATITNPTKTGYTFAGWFTAATEGSEVIGTDGKLKSGVSGYTDASGKWAKTTTTASLYAHWSGTSTAITLEPNGGTGGTSDVTATYGSSSLSSTITNPTQTGYTFAGWFSAETGGVAVIGIDGKLKSSVPGFTDASGNWNNVASEVTLYAHWGGTPTTITLEANGGSGSTPSVTAVYGSPSLSSSITNPTQTGYTFAGWFSETTDGVQVIDLDGDLISGVSGYTDASGNWCNAASTVTLYAHWTQNPVYTVTVTYDETKGTASASPVNAEAGTTITLTATANDGYLFKEWTSSPAVTITDNKFTMPASDVAIVAVFEKKSTPSSGGSSHQGGSRILAATDAPTVTSTQQPTSEAIPTIPAVKQTTQPTQKSPAPFVGILVGLGAAALVARLGRR